MVSVHVERVRELPEGATVAVDVDGEGNTTVWMLEGDISQQGAADLARALTANRPFFRLLIPRQIDRHCTERPGVAAAG